MNIGASYSTVRESDLLSHVVPLYRIDGPTDCRFWQRGVNDTYRVHGADSIHSLRVYRHGLRSMSEIDFEIAALEYLHERGAGVARPIARRDGGFVSEIHAPEGPRQVIVTTHAKGTEPNYDDAGNARLFGESVAELHEFSDGFETRHARPRLDVEHLLGGSMDVIVPFLRYRPEDLAFLEDTESDLRRAVDDAGPENLDTGFCHGDCHGSNVHLDGDTLTHFDFDCCGFGLRVFELATFKWGIRGDDNEDELWSMFLEGYRSGREIGAEDLALVDPFVVIRHLWWMALIMGNARDFGARATGDEFIDNQIRRLRKMST